MTKILVNNYYYYLFSNSLIIHEVKTKETSTVKKVDPNYHKIECTFVFNFSEND